MNIPKLRAPIVLVHGLMGFDRIDVAGRTVACYFPGILDLLHAAGNRAFSPCLTPTAGIADRARELKDFILRRSPHDPVHIFAHSMGGLDARYMISCLGMDKHVLSLTTLGTPHRGTAFADWGIQTLAWMVRPTLEFLGVPIQAFYDLTTASCARFNANVLDVPGVRYFSVAAQHDGNFLSPEWLVPYHIVLKSEGHNDGVVSVSSAKFGEDLAVWEGDHMSLVNWLHPTATVRGVSRNTEQRYGSLIQRLADEGF